MVSQYFAQVGRDWARATILPGVELLAKKGKGRTSPPLYEVDPNAPQEQQNMAIANLSEVVECVVDQVVASAGRAPSELKSLCYGRAPVIPGIRSTLTDSQPELADQVLGNILILRFLGPLLTTPGDIGITVSENDLKATRFTAKVLTNLANGILFGGKEEHMWAFNGLLESRAAAIHRFYVEIATETLNWTDPAQGSEHEKEAALKLVFDLNNRYVQSGLRLGLWLPSSQSLTCGVDEPQSRHSVFVKYSLNLLLYRIKAKESMREAPA